MDYSDQVEFLGIDGSWVDVTGSTHLFGTGEQIANTIRNRVQKELGITVSAGVSFNKIFAKLGSDMKNPNTATVITKENFKDITWPLPASELFGVGRATQATLLRYRIKTIGAIAMVEPAMLKRWFGSRGLLLHSHANGIDYSGVRSVDDSEPLVKSVGNSTTCPRDLENEEDARVVFQHLAESVSERMRELGLCAKTLQISLRTSDLLWRELQTDLDLYDFFKSHGTDVVNDAADFTGANGCYLYKVRDVPANKNHSLKDSILVLAPHDGIVSSETWLACRKKLMNNTAFSPARKAKNTWLAGKIKCAKCGTSLAVRIFQGVAYLHCRRRMDSKSCEGCGTLKLSGVENTIHKAMCRKVVDYQTLTRSNSSKATPKLTALKVSLAQVEAEIDDLLKTLKGANAMLLSYANKMIEELDGRKQLLCKQIADMSTETIAPKQIERISVYLDNWSDVSYDDKRIVLDGLITSVKAANVRFDIDWKI